jgi:RNA polymerase sigma factor (sigma-70 family)
MTASEYFERFENGGYTRTIQLLKRLGVPADDAAEYAQAGWVRCLAYIHKLRSESSLDWYVATAALRLFQTEYRRSTRRCPLDELGTTGPDQSMSVIVIDVRRALSNLKPLDHLLLQQLYIEGTSYAELADRLRTTESRLYAKVARARRAFRQLMTGVTDCNSTSHLSIVKNSAADQSLQHASE